MRSIIYVLIFLSFLFQAGANDSIYLRKITDTLSSPYFMGRGYVDDGMQKAATFIANEWSQMGLAVQQQPLFYPVNIFPGNMALTLNGKPLEPGTDFIIGAESKACSTICNLQQADSVTYINQKEKLIVKLVDKLTWTVSVKQEEYTIFYVLSSALTGPPSSVICRVDARLEKKFKAENIIASIPGIEKPDSFLLFTAHYDHLGGMGSQTFFPGANDNAGGVALMLSLAKYYLLHPPRYTVLFMAFAGEEAGLLGSEYYVNHPLYPLAQARFLINLDLVGNGEEGITVVNATEFPKEFALLQKINTEKKLLTAVNGRGKARNSDHYWFTEKGVPSFFIYTLGKRKAYHDVDDIAATVPWPEANDLQTLIIQFMNELPLLKKAVSK